MFASVSTLEEPKPEQYEPVGFDPQDSEYHSDLECNREESKYEVEDEPHEATPSSRARSPGKYLKGSEYSPLGQQQSLFLQESKDVSTGQEEEEPRCYQRV